MSEENGAWKRGYMVWNPRAEKRQILDHVDEVFAEYDLYKPLTGRQIYYRRVGGCGYPKGTAFEKNLGDVLHRGRKSRRIPFSWSLLGIDPGEDVSRRSYPGRQAQLDQLSHSP
jgi:hypothetical protein